MLPISLAIDTIISIVFIISYKPSTFYSFSYAIAIWRRRRMYRFTLCTNNVFTIYIALFVLYLFTYSIHMLYYHRRLYARPRVAIIQEEEGPQAFLALALLMVSSWVSEAFCHLICTSLPSSLMSPLR